MSNFQKLEMGEQEGENFSLETHVYFDILFTLLNYKVQDVRIDIGDNDSSGISS